MFNTLKYVVLTIESIVIIIFVSILRAHFRAHFSSIQINKIDYNCINKLNLKRLWELNLVT